MEDLLKLNREDIARDLKPQSLRTTQIIQLATIIGTVLFFLVCIAINATVEGPPAGEPEMEMLMLPILGLMFIGALIGASLVPKLILKPDSLAGRAADIGGDPIEWALAIHRVVMLVRMSLFEVVAIFGLVILILAAMGNRLGEHPIIWLSALPLLIHVVYGFVTFPSKNTVVEFIDTSIIKPLRHRSG